jgi:thiamine pyrophosphate-dependent acetolactate synthase large subunit-like protein
MVEHPGELTDAFDRAFEGRRPYVVEALVDPEVPKTLG